MRLIWYCSRRAMNYLKKEHTQKKRTKLKKKWNEIVVHPGVSDDWVHVYNSTHNHKTQVNLLILVSMCKRWYWRRHFWTIYSILYIIFTFISVGQCVCLNAPLLFISRLPSKRTICICVRKKLKQNQTKQQQKNKHKRLPHVCS